MNDRELFDKYSKLVWKGIRVITFNQFAKLITERDAERVCKNCEFLNKFDFCENHLSEIDNIIAEPEKWGCNQFKERGSK